MAGGASWRVGADDAPATALARAGRAMPSVLGVIIAGGASRRFGADKAEAAWRGRSLIDHAVAALLPQVRRVVVCGRDYPGYRRIDDRPSGVGPIGGVAAAIHQAAASDHEGALCVPVDVHPLPLDLAARLYGPAPAVLNDQHMIGWWPSSLADDIDDFIAGGGRSINGWIERCGARRVADPPGLINVNRRQDLARLPLP